MKLKSIIALFCVAFLPFSSQAQEALMKTYGNPALQNQVQRSSNERIPLKKQAAATISLSLPFFDDFTNDGPYPDSLRWQDKFAFVNTAFQKNPVNRGVATLDALDADGKIYENASQYLFMADYLTSHPIRTDSIWLNERMEELTPSDSLYLSFYYQPQGMGDAPNTRDSLLLEFFVQYADTTVRIDSIYHPNDTLWINELDHTEGWSEIIPAYHEYDTILTIIPEQWRRIWASEGMRLDTFYNRYGQWMRNIMIPILDTADFRSDFRFRFRNYASISSSTLPSWQSDVDQWNIDYVYLNHSRFWFDTTYHDLSFLDPGESFLKDFSAMPLRQFAADPYSSMKSQFTTTYVNLDNVNQNASYKYRVYDQEGNQIGSDNEYYSIEWTNVIPPFVNEGIQSLPVDVILMFPTDEKQFTIKQTLIGDVAASNRLSDSITFVQIFDNYFAYDDGVPEAGYGLSFESGMLAVRFPLTTLDTLQAVDIFFNTTPERQSVGHLEYFNLMVWADNHGEPGDTLYTSSQILQSGEAGKFVRFYVDQMLRLSSGFFIGVQQTTDDNINIGFDYSNNMQSRNFFKVYNDPWQQSSYEGTLMIRPVMGKPVKITPSSTSQNKKSLSVFPNPLTIEQNIVIQKPESFEEEHDMTVTIYNEIGRKVYESVYTKPQITLTSVPNGLYIIKLSNHTLGESATTKLLIIR